MNVLLAAMVVVVFASVLQALGLPLRAKEVGARSADSLRVLRDPELDDDAKARAMRRQAGHLFALFGILVAGSALALGLPLGAIWVVDQAGLASLREVVAVLERPDFLLGTLVVGGGGFLVLRFVKRP